MAAEAALRCARDATLEMFDGVGHDLPLLEPERLRATVGALSGEPALGLSPE